MSTAQPLEARICRVTALGENDRQRMFHILQKYYEHVSFEVFLRDLNAKDEVILLLRPDDETIQGFSTLKFFTLQLGNKSVPTVFSGDTIVEKEFWGQTALQRAFVRRLMTEKLKKPFSPLYWFLISKGYKTYLLMANNFTRYYPNVEGSVSLKAVTEACARHLFHEKFDAETGLISFGENAPRLREKTAPIEQELLLQNPKIQFFAERNPNWASGIELACVAELNVSMVLKFLLKLVAKSLGLRIGQRRLSPASQPSPQPALLCESSKRSPIA